MSKRANRMFLRPTKRRSPEAVGREEQRQLIARRIYPEREIPPRRMPTDETGRPITLPRVSILESEI
jgi:hypothetical protein